MGSWIMLVKWICVPDYQWSYSLMCTPVCQSSLSPLLLSLPLLPERHKAWLIVWIKHYAEKNVKEIYYQHQAPEMERDDKLYFITPHLLFLPVLSLFFLLSASSPSLSLTDLFGLFSLIEALLVDTESQTGNKGKDHNHNGSHGPHGHWK